MSDPIPAAAGFGGPALPLRIVAAVGLAAGGLVFLVAGTSVAGGPHATGYGAAAPAAGVVGTLTAAVLLAVGAIALLWRAEATTGSLVMALGATWSAAEAVGWADGPLAVRSVAMVLAPILLPLLAHLGLSFPHGAVASRSDRRLLMGTYTAACVMAVGTALFYDPFLDLHCWRNCVGNLFVVAPAPGVAAALAALWLGVVVAAGGVTGVRVVGRLVAGGRSGLRWLAPVLALVSATLGIAVVRAARLLLGPPEQPTSTLDLSLFVAQGVALTAVGLGIAWVMARQWRVRRSLATLVGDLEAASAAGSLEAILSRALGDDTLDVYYRLPTLGRYVDARGRAVDLPDHSGRAVTAVMRGGDELGLVVHDPALAVPDLVREIGSAAHLAIDNERLRAELLNQVSEIRMSQARIVAAADASRQRLERDLHDGAQQGMLALSYEVRLACNAATSEGGPLVGTLTAARHELGMALDDLRDVAHGIFPSILADGGLSRALSVLAERSTVPVEVDATDARFDPTVEMAAYLIVHDVAEAAAARCAELVTATATATDGGLEVALLVDGAAPAGSDLVRVADRVGAMGGEVTVAGGEVKAVIPCG